MGFALCFWEHTSIWNQLQQPVELPALISFIQLQHNLLEVTTLSNLLNLLTTRLKSRLEKVWQKWLKISQDQVSELEMRKKKMEVPR